MLVPSRLNTRPWRDGSYSAPLKSFERPNASFVMSVGLAESHEPRPARLGGKGPLAGLYALERTSGVVTGRQPSNAPRESVPAGRGTAQPCTPLRGIPPLKRWEEVNQAECLFSLVQPWLQKFHGLSR